LRLIAFFTTISGKPLDGFLMLTRPSLGGALTHVMRSRTGRAGIFVAGARVGLLFFAK
jgi:hypothetical protein